MASYIERMEARKAAEEREKSLGVRPKWEKASQAEAEKYFDMDWRGAKGLKPEDIENAANLLGVPHGMNSDLFPETTGPIDRGLLEMGDDPGYSGRYSWSERRPDSPANSPLLDPLYSASSGLRGMVNKVAPGMVDAIDGADAWLHEKTGELLGTPENISPRGQLNLRKAYRKNLDMDQGTWDYYNVK